MHRYFRPLKMTSYSKKMVDQCIPSTQTITLPKTNTLQVNCLQMFIASIKFMHIVSCVQVKGWHCSKISLTKYNLPDTGVFATGRKSLKGPQVQFKPSDIFLCVHLHLFVNRYLSYGTFCLAWMKDMFF